MGIMRVLVTGGSGFIGRRCLEALRPTGFEVHAVSSRELASSPNRGVVWHRADLHDERAANRLIDELRPSHLLHLAWYVEPTLYWESSENTRWMNSSVDLIRSFASHGERIVAAGTSAEYDWRFGFCSEDLTPIAPSTAYGSCKHTTHQRIREAVGAGGPTIAWGRIFAAYGPGEPREKVVSKAAHTLLGGASFHSPSDRRFRDYVFVDDIAHALVSLLTSCFDGALNIGSGIPVSIADIVKAVATEVGRLDLVKVDPPDDGETEAPLVLADVRRLQAVLGWLPEHDLKTGVRRTIDSLRTDSARLGLN